MEPQNISMLTPSPLSNTYDYSHVSPNLPVRVYIVTYLTSLWPHGLAPSLHPVYSEQYDGLIGIYSDLESAAHAGNTWLKKRIEEMEEAVPKDRSRPGDVERAKWTPRGWNQVFEEGVLYDIWTNWIDGGMSRAIVKIRANVVCGIVWDKENGVVREHREDEEVVMNEKEKEEAVTPYARGEGAVIPYPRPNEDSAPYMKKAELGIDKYDNEQAVTPYIGNEEAMTPYVRGEEVTIIEKDIEEAVTPYMRVQESVSPYIGKEEVILDDNDEEEARNRSVTVSNVGSLEESKGQSRQSRR